MKRKITKLTLSFATLFLIACTKDVAYKDLYNPIDYSKLVTIKQGLWGGCLFLSGNCMPGSNNTCKTDPIHRQIYIYAVAVDSQTVHIGSNFYSQINTTLVAQTQSDDNGFYQVKLQPGNYSVLILEDGKYYCSSWGGHLEICPVSINTNQATRRDLVIDMSVQ